VNSRLESRERRRIIGSRYSDNEYHHKPQLRDDASELEQRTSDRIDPDDAGDYVRDLGLTCNAKW